MFFEKKPSQGYIKLKKKDCYFEAVLHTSCEDDVIAPALFPKDVMKWLFKENVIQLENVPLKLDIFLKTKLK